MNTDFQRQYRIARLAHRAPITYPLRNALFALLKRFMSFEAIKTYPHGLQLCLDLTDYIGFRIWEKGAWERDVLALTKALLQGGGVFVDVGAHCGYFTVWMAREFRDKLQVFGFEPNARVARLARRSAELNGLSNLTMDPRAVSDQTGSITLYVQPEGNSGQSGLIKRLGARQAVSVPTVTLADALAHYRIDEVDLLKLDVEGAEALVLPSIAPLLKQRRIKALLVELHKLAESGFGVPLENLIRILRDSSYQLYHFDENDRLVPTEQFTLDDAPSRHVLALRPGQALPVLESPPKT